MIKTPNLRAVLAAAAMILAGLGYLVAQHVALMADPNPRGTFSASQAVLWPASALAIMVGLGLLVVAATHEFGRRPQILLGITVALPSGRPNDRYRARRGRVNGTRTHRARNLLNQVRMDFAERSGLGMPRTTTRPRCWGLRVDPVICGGWPRASLAIGIRR